MNTRASPARELAWRVLDSLRRRPGKAAERLERALAQSDCARADLGLATELVLGVVRRRATLDAVVQRFTRLRQDRVEPGAWLLCALGTYQLLFLTRVPQYAAVHETAELCRALRRPRWTSFVNGVLRAVARDLTGQFGDEPAANAVPCAPGRYLRLRSRVFPDPRMNLTGYFAQAFSFPEWLAARWNARMADDNLLHLGFWFNAPPPMTLRVNTLKTSRDALLAELAARNIPATPGEHPLALCVEHAGPVSALFGFDQGYFAVQDASAMWAVSLLAPAPGERVLDLCSAPGGKTAHLAAEMGNRGAILATDVSREKLERVKENCARLGVSIVATRCISRDANQAPQGPFDAILADVPCSNTGVLAKRADARWRLRPSDLVCLPRVQRGLLLRAAEQLAPGGRLVYSTCSIEPEENEEVVRAVLAERPALGLGEERHHWPGRPADGGYQALLVNNPVPAERRVEAGLGSRP